MLFITDTYPSYSLSCWNLNKTSQKYMFLLVLIDCLHRKMTSLCITFFKRGKEEGGGVFSISEFFNFLFTLHTVYHLKQFQQLKSACWYLEWNVLIYKLHFFFFIQLQYSSTTPLPHLLLLYPWFQLICLEQNVSLFWGWGTTNFYRF